MAGFRTHITTSTALGVAYGVGGAGLMGIPVASCVIAGGLCSVSGMLPDLDSDSGVPLRESVSFGSAVIPIMMLDRFELMGMSHEDMVIGAGLIYLFIRFVVAKIFMRYTVHRGMWHSIPAAAICGLVAYLVCSCSPTLRVYKAGAVVLGFLSHLVLDEIYSFEVGKRGRVRIKKSFGTALKLWSKKPWANISTYGKLAFLLTLVFVGERKFVEYFEQQEHKLHYTAERFNRVLHRALGEEEEGAAGEDPWRGSPWPAHGGADAPPPAGASGTTPFTTAPRRYEYSPPPGNAPHNHNHNHNTSVGSAERNDAEIRNLALSETDRLECRSRSLDFLAAEENSHRRGCRLRARSRIELVPVDRARHEGDAVVLESLDHQVSQPRRYRQLERRVSIRVEDPFQLARVVRGARRAEGLEPLDVVRLQPLRVGPSPDPLHRGPERSDHYVGVRYIVRGDSRRGDRDAGEAESRPGDGAPIRVPSTRAGPPEGIGGLATVAEAWDPGRGRPPSRGARGGSALRRAGAPCGCRQRARVADKRR